MIERLVHVFRGGSWYHYSYCLRASFRNWFVPVDIPSNDIGFRLVVRIKDE